MDYRRIGRQYVGEHVGGDDRVAEQIEQHDLESAEEDEREANSDHDSRTSERDAPDHIESERHQQRGFGRPGPTLLLRLPRTSSLVLLVSFMARYPFFIILLNVFVRVDLRHSPFGDPDLLFRQRSCNVCVLFCSVSCFCSAVI